MFPLIGFFVTLHVKNRCDRIGLDLLHNPGAQSIPGSPVGMLFNPAEETVACVWGWKYQLICLKAITV